MSSQPLAGTSASVKVHMFRDDSNIFHSAQQVADRREGLLAGGALRLSSNACLTWHPPVARWRRPTASDQRQLARLRFGPRNSAALAFTLNCSSATLAAAENRRWTKPSKSECCGPAPTSRHPSPYYSPATAPASVMARGSEPISPHATGRLGSRSALLAAPVQPTTSLMDRDRRESSPSTTTTRRSPTPRTPPRHTALARETSTSRSSRPHAVARPGIRRPGQQRQSQRVATASATIVPGRRLIGLIHHSAVCADRRVLASSPGRHVADSGHRCR